MRQALTGRVNISTFASKTCRRTSVTRLRRVAAHMQKQEQELPRQQQQQPLPPLPPPGAVDLLPAWPSGLRKRVPAAPPPPRSSNKTPRVSPRGRYGLPSLADAEKRKRDPAPPITRPQPPSAFEFYFAVAAAAEEEEDSSNLNSSSSTSSSSSSTSPHRRRPLFSGNGESDGDKPYRASAVLRRKASPGFTRAGRWTTLRDRALRRWLRLLDAPLGVVALKRLAALQPPPARAGAEREPVRCARVVVAEARARLAGAAVAAAANAVDAATAETALLLPQQQQREAFSAADAAAIARGFEGAAAERAEFDLVAAAACAALSGRAVRGASGAELASLARHAGRLGVRHDGFWRAWCARAAELAAAPAGGSDPLPIGTLAPSLEAMQTLQFAPPLEFLRAVHAYTQPRLARLSLKVLGRLARACGSFVPGPDDAWWVEAKAAAAAAVATTAGTAAVGSGGDSKTDALAVARLLLGCATCAAAATAAAGPAASSAKAESLPTAPGWLAAAEWCRGMLAGAAGRGELEPPAAAVAAKACARVLLVLSRGSSGGDATPGVKQQQQQQQQQWRALLTDCLDAALAGGSAPADERSLAALASALSVAAAAGCAPPAAEWLAALEAALLPRLATLPAWLSLDIVSAVAAGARTAPPPSWLGAALMALRPWAPALSGAQLARLAADVGTLLRLPLPGALPGAPSDAGAGASAALPATLIAGFAAAAHERASAAAAGSGDDGPLLRTAAEQFSQLAVLRSTA